MSLQRHLTGSAIGNVTRSGETSPLVNYCTFIRNEGFNGGAIINSVISGINPFHGGGILDTLSWCTFDLLPGQGSFPPARAFDAGNNLDTNPQFINPLSHNLQLQQTSPCLEAGSINHLPIGITEYLDGSPPSNGIVDIGAYENPFINCPDSLEIVNTYSPFQGTYVSKNSLAVHPGSQIFDDGTAILGAPEVNIMGDFFVNVGS